MDGVTEHVDLNRKERKDHSDHVCHVLVVQLVKFKMPTVSV